MLHCVAADISIIVEKIKNMLKTKSLHLRLPRYLYQQIEARSAIVGCSNEDFVKKALELAINGYSEFDFKDKPIDEEIE